MIEMNTVHISATYNGIQIHRIGGWSKSKIHPSCVTKAAATSVHLTDPSKIVVLSLQPNTKKEISRWVSTSKY